MIPIECPNCGRRGSVPSDRLNSRLVCKVCHIVFHLDDTGHMMMGEPGSNGPKPSKTRAEKVTVIEEFDLAQTLKEIPRPVKYGVPGVLVAVIGYLFLASGERIPGYIGQGETIVRALASNDRPRVVSYATPDSGEAAGEWFDLWHGELVKDQLTSNIDVKSGLYGGMPDKDENITLMVIVVDRSGAAKPAAISLPLRRDGSAWKFDGTKALAVARLDLAATKIDR